jgi:hypothetical protein
MAVDKEKIERVLNQLSDELRQEVLQFAESLVRRTASTASNGTSSVHSLFGVWSSGDPLAADNDRIDLDLAREIASPHEAK